MGEGLSGLDIVVHRVQEAIKGLEFAFEPHQNQKIDGDMRPIEKLFAEVVVDEYLHETLVGCVLVVRIGSDATHPVVLAPICENELHQVDPVGVGVQFLLDGVGHLQVGGRKA